MKRRDSSLFYVEADKKICPGLSLVFQVFGLVFRTISIFFWSLQSGKPG